ncbi:hypothetical protein [uncultured Planktosalinus sp.]|uniref:hypothetical protein n=1 Tax=uncultured Planktosalinus sp. TaxID=1810935 RepID=UPI0030D8A509
MKASIIFDREMRRILKTETSETLLYVQDQFLERNRSSYMGFFDDFLFEYGVISLNAIPIDGTHKYMPYVNCMDDNIFGEAKGCTDLSVKGLSLAACQKVIVHYIIDHLKRLDLSVLKEWKARVSLS